VKALSLFYLASLGLCLPLPGQETAFSENETLEKAPSTPQSENLLSNGVAGSIEIEMLINPSDMTITESDEFEAQTSADIGARFIIAEIDENLSKTLKMMRLSGAEPTRRTPKFRNAPLAHWRLL
jgi:hypothetical protein